MKEMKTKKDFTQLVIPELMGRVYYMEHVYDRSSTVRNFHTGSWAVTPRFYDPETGKVGGYYIVAGQAYKQQPNRSDIYNEFHIFTFYND